MFFKQRALPDHLRDSSAWLAMARETRPISRDAAEQAVAALYGLAGLRAPRFRWYSSPRAALWSMCGKDLDGARVQRAILSQRLRREPAVNRWRRIRRKLADTLWREITEITTQKLFREIGEGLLQPLESELACHIRGSPHFHGQLDALWLAFYDVCRACGVRYGNSDERVLDGWMAEARSCFLWWPLPSVCLLSERPSEMRIDSEGRLHAELRPALRFADGWEVFCISGERVPPELGRTPPEEWDLGKLFSGGCQRTRMRLLARVGYEKIARDLPKTRLDSWREYSLFRIEAKVDSEPLHVLSMICPSTGKIHVTRVHPSVTSARDAVTWLNRGIDPELFAAEH